MCDLVYILFPNTIGILSQKMSMKKILVTLIRLSIKLLDNTNRRKIPKEKFTALGASNSFFFNFDMWHCSNMLKYFFRWPS